MIITTAQSAPSGETQAKLVEARAIRYTCDAWFPAHPEHLKFIRRKLKDGVYTTTLGLLEDLRGDFALFGYVVKEIGARVAAGDGAQDLVQRIRDMEVRELQRFIPISETRISNHRFAELHEAQLGRLQHFMLSTSAVHALAEEQRVDEITAICGLFFRQVGFALVCWNYPRIYSKAMQTTYDSQRSFDRSIASVLGFSPRSLGVQLARSWGASQALIDVIQGKPDPAPVVAGLEPPPARLFAPEVELLMQFCEIGEAYARSHDGAHFRHADRERRWATELLTKGLGVEGFKAFEKKLREVWASYSSAQPGAASAAATVDAEPGGSGWENNPFLAGCPESIQHLLRPLYSSVQAGQPSPVAIKRLVETTIIETGFESGCIYLVDAKDLRMIPNVVIGPFRRESYQPVFSLTVGSLSDPLTRAYMGGAPVKGHAIRGGDTKVLYIAGPIGTGVKRGVLYLETSHPGYLSGEADLQACFCALHHVLCASLNVDPQFHPLGASSSPESESGTGKYLGSVRRGA